MGRNIENNRNWRKKKYEKFGADLEKEYSQKLKKAILEDTEYSGLADWIRKKGNEYLENREN